MIIDIKLFILIGIIFILYVFIKSLFHYLNKRIDKILKVENIDKDKIIKNNLRF